MPLTEEITGPYDIDSRLEFKTWKLLIDLDMKKKDLQQAAGVSPALIAKLGRNENVSTESLAKGR